MKRKIVYFAMAITLAGLLILQSCKKDPGPPIVEHWSFTEAAAVAPADGATIEITGTTVQLQWASTNESGDAVNSDVYFGTSEEPDLFKANHTALSLTVNVAKGITYYWYVVMKDANGIEVISPTFSFTIFEPIGIFVGDFLCDEPAESYSYDVGFSKKNDVTLTIDNYWNSGWVVDFAMNFTTKTYSFARMTFQTGWEGAESGTIDPETGTMVGTYTIWQNGVAIESGTHTYTKH